MKTFFSGFTRAVASASVALTLALSGSYSSADETCQSPYMAKIEGQEDFVYVWTLGVEGLGDGQSHRLVAVGEGEKHSPPVRKDVAAGK